MTEKQALFASRIIPTAFVLEKMNNLTEDEYLAMSKAALEKARENCDCEKYYEKLMNCYKDLIKAKGGKKI